mgnify:FL=1
MFTLQVLNRSLLDAIPISIFVIITCATSYWHARSEQGWGLYGLFYTIFLGIVSQIFVGFFPMF